MADKKPKPRGLGRGLSALMADVTAEPVSTEGARTPRNAEILVPIEKVQANPDQPRRQFLQEDLTAIGIDFQLNLADVAAYLEVVRAGEHNTQQWWDTQTDPDGVFRTLFHSSNAGGGTNRNNYIDEDMDAMIDAAVGIGDSEARAAAYADIQQKIADDVVMVFFNDPVVLFASTPDVSGVTILGGGFIPNFYAATVGG